MRVLTQDLPGEVLVGEREPLYSDSKAAQEPVGGRYTQVMPTYAVTVGSDRHDNRVYRN